MNGLENRDKYKELNKSMQIQETTTGSIKALTTISANRYVEKRTRNEKEGKKAIEEGRAIMQRSMKTDHFIFRSFI